ncbi:MAG: hypothetical protein EAZ11_07205 [Curvibacter sp.]|nr:MAG: hypothetical protein EAZ11_07205 [Curvibacter sp.]
MTQKDRAVGAIGMVLVGFVFSTVCWVEDSPGFAVFFLVMFGAFALFFHNASDESIAWFIRWFS